MKTTNLTTPSLNALNFIKKLKNRPYGNIKIKCDFNGLKYELLLLTKETTNNIKIVRLLAVWRKKSEKWFLKQFKITLKGTRLWLNNNVIKTPDRLLFMISVKNKYIGHIGLFRFNFNNHNCEIDNIVRGEKNYKGIMGNAIAHMMVWGKKNLLLKKYTLQTASDNKKALTLYKRLGFYESKRTPLVYIKRDNIGEWIKTPKNYQKKIKRYNISMTQ